MTSESGRTRLAVIGALLAAGLAANGAGQAQTCPAGMQPYRTGTENDGFGVALCGPVREQSTAPAPEQPYWATRWGAIATDGPRGALGTAEAQRSKRAAKQAALKQCRENGGSECKVDLTYSNQCAVMVTGKTQYTSQGAATVGEATEIGLRRCREVDENCRVYYVGCSLPQLIE